MGPEATLDLMRRVIEITPAQTDQDHIHMIIDNNPKVPSRIAAIIEKTGADPAPELIRMAKGLEAAGASLLAMPCNTAHAYKGSIAAAVHIPLLDMIALSAERLSGMKLKRGRVGLLVSRAVQIMKLYEEALASFDLLPLYPAHMDALMTIIKAVKKGDKGDATRKAFAGIADELMREADILLIACTELSVLAGSLKDIPMLDALDALTQEIVTRALALNPARV